MACCLPVLERETNMKLKQLAPMAAVFCAVVGFAAAPMIANAQSRGDSQQRSHTGNQWRDRARDGGSRGAITRLTRNRSIDDIGFSVNLYSSNQLSLDLRSHDDDRQARAELYQHPSFQHEGHTYVRKTVYRGGKQYQKFNRQN